MNVALFVIGFVAISLVLTGALLALTPWLMRKQECFAVTVPEAAQRDARLVSFKHRYTALMVIATVLDVAAMVATMAAIGEPSVGDESSAYALAWIMAAGFLLLLALSFVLMLHYRRRVRALKEAEGWVARASEAASLLDDADMPRPISLAWNLLYVPVMLLTAAIGAVGYPSMPDMVPMHADLAGNVDSYVPKSPGVAAFPVLVQAFLCVCFVACHALILRSKRAVDPARPASSAFAYGLFMRAWSAFLLAAGLVLSAAVGITFMLSSLGWLSLGAAAVVVLFVTLLIVVGSLVLSLVYGQSGARVMRRLGDASQLCSDDDEHWKLGILYWNPDDASVFLPERFGIGWTINLARPAAWAALVGFAAVVAAFVLAVMALVGA